MSETDVDVIARADYPGLDLDQFDDLCFNVSAFLRVLHSTSDPRSAAMHHLALAIEAGDDDEVLGATVRELVKRIARIEAGL